MAVVRRLAGASVSPMVEESVCAMFTRGEVGLELVSKSVASVVVVLFNPLPVYEHLFHDVCVKVFGGADELAVL